MSTPQFQTLDPVPRTFSSSNRRGWARCAWMTLGLAGALCASALAADPPSTNPPPKPSASSLLKLDDGRAGRGNLIATTGIRGFAKPPSATAHALIMTIGDYQGGIPKLKGVMFDTATATAIATRMGVPEGNITALKDGDLTIEGMRKALDDLEAKLGGNDQVFIYYSGHGGRQLVQEDGSERCAESLISVDGRGLCARKTASRNNWLVPRAFCRTMWSSTATPTWC